MASCISSCLSELNYDHLVYIAYKKFYEGISTIELMQRAVSNQEKEEIALVALLEVEEDLCVELKHQSPSVLKCQLSEFKRSMVLSIQKGDSLNSASRFS